MNTFLTKIKSFFIAHKILSVVIVLFVGGISYYTYHKATSTAGDTRYIITKARLGTIIASVSGTGQVTDVNQIDVKSKVSGDVVLINAQNGAHVAAGTLVLEIDPTDANKVVRDAAASLQSAELSLAKLKIQNSDTNLSADVLKTYTDGFNTVSSTFLDLPGVLINLENTLNEDNLSESAARLDSKTAQNYRSLADNARFLAEKAFNENRINYIALNANSSHADIENLIKQTYATTKLVSEAVKDTVSYAAFMADQSEDTTQFNSELASLSANSDTTNSDLSALLTAETTINNNKDTFQNADLDLQSEELAVQAKQNALEDAKDKLADYFIRAPLAGVVANLDAKKADSISSGSIVATIVTPKQLALISLNEVDVAKIKLGQKATLTFDAIPDLTIAGTVSEIDTIGTVAQGVVTYDVKVNFDTEDARVKPSMSVSAEIITDMKQDVLTVPNSAVKSQNGASYVEVFDPPLPPPADGLPGSISKIAPNKVPIEIGLANDSLTEIISGLKEGDEIVSRTIAGTTTTTTTAPSLFGSPARPATGGAAGGNRTFRAN